MGGDAADLRACVCHKTNALFTFTQELGAHLRLILCGHIVYDIQRLCMSILCLFIDLVMNKQKVMFTCKTENTDDENDM